MDELILTIVFWWLLGLSIVAALFIRLWVLIGSWREANSIHSYIIYLCQFGDAKIFFLISSLVCACVWDFHWIAMNEREFIACWKPVFCWVDNLHCLFLMLFVSFTCLAFVFVVLFIKFGGCWHSTCVRCSRMIQFRWTKKKKFKQSANTQKAEAMNHICVCLMSTEYNECSSPENCWFALWR